jgi:hypothetical protein
MKFRTGWTLALGLALGLAAARPARADVVGSPPDSCTAGSVPATCHGGPYCALASCVSDDDCDEGKACLSTKLCTSEIDCGGGGGPAPTVDVAGPCGASCAGLCTSQTVCVTPPSATSGSAGGSSTGTGSNGGGGSGGEVVVTGCACSLDGRAVGGALGGLMLGVGLLGLAARRGRRPRSR